MDLLEWNPTGPEYFSCGHSPNISIQYNRCQAEDYKRELIKSRRISYMDGCFYRSTKKPTDMDIVEWNPIGFSGLEPSIRHNHHRRAANFRIQNFDMESILSFDEPLLMHESRNFQELDEPKLLEQPQTLLLGWDHNSEKYESFLTSSSTSPHSSPYITRHLKKEHLLTSSISSYTPKHLIAVEDCNIKFPLQDYNTWCMNKSLDEEEHRLSESSLFLIQSPVNKPLSFLNTGLHSLVDDEKEENFVYSSDQLLKSSVNDYSSSRYMEPVFDKHFDHTDYPLLLLDSSMNDEF
ncbi:hypothetical protein M8C21_011591 [Ambrosia artemisiifolia]|uniref:Uncharacterized protein n=1 Tax=Ambrosia artemisiifolia TaxID=4212 RepID=A0AAD5GS14_AMBAR|nr:hypothetical protein M8C21_011591 [Ambrosia artemisiifolia]